MTAKTTPTPEVTIAPTAAEAFDFAVLKMTCETHETEAGTVWGMDKTYVKQHAPHNYYFFKDNGADILAVAHLDTVVMHEDRTATMVDKAGVVYSGALDDRLGVYVITDMLPKMGITCDWLFTVGEEHGMSTAEFFNPEDHGKDGYNWIIEFDRGGTDVVMYQYEDEQLVTRIGDEGMDMAQGIFSDISAMEHLGTKAINWGVGYRDYHSTRGHVWLTDLFYMIDGFASFHDEWAETPMPHVPQPAREWSRYDDDHWATVATGEDCAAERWGVGECSGALSVHSDLEDTLCENHTRWYDNT